MWARHLGLPQWHDSTEVLEYEAVLLCEIVLSSGVVSVTAHKRKEFEGYDVQAKMCEVENVLVADISLNLIMMMARPQGQSQLFVLTCMPLSWFRAGRTNSEHNQNLIGVLHATLYVFMLFFGCLMLSGHGRCCTCELYFLANIVLQSAKPTQELQSCRQGSSVGIGGLVRFCIWKYVPHHHARECLQRISARACCFLAGTSGRPKCVIIHVANVSKGSRDDYMVVSKTVDVFSCQGVLWRLIMLYFCSTLTGSQRARYDTKLSLFKRCSCARDMEGTLDASSHHENIMTAVAPGAWKRGRNDQSGVEELENTTTTQR